MFYVSHILKSKKCLRRLSCARKSCEYVFVLHDCWCNKFESVLFELSMPHLT